MNTVSAKRNLSQKFGIISNTIAAIFASIFLSGCGEWVLRADFDNYSTLPATNEALEGPIKGKPEGDQIKVSCFTGNADILSGNPNMLRIDGCSEFMFIPADHSPPSGYKIDWVGKRNTASDTGLTFITFIDDSNPLDDFFFRFHLGLLEIVQKSNQEILATVDVHDFATHKIRMELNIDAKTAVDFWFQENFGDGTSGPLIKHSFELPNFKKVSAMRIDTEPNASYEIADLDIFATK